MTTRLFVRNTLMNEGTSEGTSGPLVVALAYDRMGAFEFGCVTEIFALPRPELGADWYRFAVCSYERGPLRVSGGVQLSAPHSLSLLDGADIVIVPGWRDPDETPPEPVLAALRAAHARGARVCSICSGAFVLAWAGLLDGCRATTHWRLSAKLGRDFPAIDVVDDALYVDAGACVTSAGSAAGLDMLLHLVAQDYGQAVAAAVTRRLIMQPMQPRLPTQPALPALPQRASQSPQQARLLKLIEDVRRTLDRPHTVASLAREAAMSSRTLQRQFQEITGMPPYEWLLQERVSRAKQLLETPRATLAHICERVGFFSEESLRHHFRRLAGVSPSHYRRTVRQRSQAGSWPGGSVGRAED
jgi:AraC family transcriptional activator FtrA